MISQFGLKKVSMTIVVVLCCALCALFITSQALADTGSDSDLAAGTTADTQTDNTAATPAATPFKGHGIFFVTLESDAKKVVGMKNNKRVNDVTLVVAKKRNKNLLKFAITSAGKGLYYVRNVATRHFLTADEDTETTGGAIMNTGEERKFQKWKIEVNADKSVTFTNPATSLRLNLAKGSTKKGTKLNVRPAEDADAQKFVLKKAKKRKEIVKIGVPCYMQRPQLPTGCESVALTNAIRYWGYKLSKTAIADRWMPYGSSGVYNFIGNPRDSSGWIICAPGIARTANKYLESKDSNVEASVVKGESLKSLRKYLDKGYPVVVWTTIGMGSPGGVQTVKSGYPLRSNNHAVVLTGYNPKNGKYQVSDSLAGRVWRNGKAFTRLFNAMGKQAVVLSN